MEKLRYDYATEEELITGLRNVNMLTDPEIYPYADKRIKVVEMNPWDIIPCQRYVLYQELQKVRDLRNAVMKETGIDILYLNGFLDLWFDDENGEQKNVTVIPPVVELQSLGVRGASFKPLLNDGMHRVYLALIAGENVKVAYIDMSRTNKFPYYAYPVLRGWNGVEIRHDLPEGYCKKVHVQANYKDLFRNFNNAFGNCSAPRGRIK